MDRLERYRQKRDFRRTAEPAGAAARARQAEAGAGRYVMHHHAASHDHFDLRLEQHGVLRSWALPRGASLAPGEKRLAVEVEDHPLEYGDFEGVIPAGEYGGGTVMLWDEGHWICHRQNDDRIDLELCGTKLQGRWTLTRMRGARQRDQRSWLFIKRSDDRDAPLPAPDDLSVVSGRSMDEIAADHDRQWPSRDERLHAPDVTVLPGARKAPWPDGLAPQLATAAERVPAGDWFHEIKLDGYRILAHLDEGRVRLMTRNGQDWSHRFSALAKQLAAWPVRRAILDGEVVALRPDGISNFALLQQALSDQRTDALVYQVFDLLYLDDTLLTGCSNLLRKQALSDLMRALGDTPGGRVRYTDHLEGNGQALLTRLCEMGLEGVIAKRAQSTYRSRRSRDWLKLKCARHDEFVIGGYTPPSGTREAFGSLLLGAWNAQGQFVYAGRVGTGFNQRQLRDIQARLDAQAQPDSPFVKRPPQSRGAVWVAPTLVVEVAYSERTRDGVLRHPAFHGLREDRDAGEIMMSHPERDSAGHTASQGKTPETVDVAGVRITHPARVLYPEQGMTKLALARFYQAHAEQVLPGLMDRPLSLLRCPEGLSTECFFQKHPRRPIAARVPRLRIPGKSGSAEYVYVHELADLVALVQAGVMELHPWGSRIDDLEHPDQLVFDLDPENGVPWRKTVAQAHAMREHLEELGLNSFVRTTGGKGLHVVVPLKARADWDDAKQFARALCERQAEAQPALLTTNPLKQKRRGKIFLDYLRNARGATAVASYTVRARPGAPVAVPLRWDELTVALTSDRYTVDNLRRRLAALKSDPWADFDDARRPLTAAMLRAVGAG